MKKAACYIRCLLILVFFFASGTASFAKNADVAPGVSIITPIEHAVVSGDTLNVIVWFFSKDKGQANVLYLRLEMDGKEVAVYRNKANVKEENHTFSVEIAHLEPGEHTLQAFAYQGDINAGLEAQSPVSIFVKSGPNAAPRVINNIMADPRGIYVDNPTEVLVTAEITPDPDLVTSEVSLQKLDDLNQPAGFLGYMHDDGQDGDVK